MKLYTYYRSSASYRVRIALNLKGIEYDQQHVHLLKGNGEQFGEMYRKINPQCLLPSLEIGQGVLHESLAIIEYLDEVYESSPLLPEDPWMKAQIRAFAYGIACDIQPLANLRVQKYLNEHLDISRGHTQGWLSHWISSGLKAMEKKLEAFPESKYCFGEEPTLADIVLVPQMYNAHRSNIETMPLHRLERVFETCMTHPAFEKAAPENQPDAERH